MSYNKLIIISTNELDRRIGVLFQIEELIRRGFRLEYWNISEITYKERVKPMPIDLPQVDIKSHKTFKKLVKGNVQDKVLYIFYANYAFKTSLCYLILSKYNAHLLYCINGVLPQVLSPYHSLRALKTVDILKRVIAKLLLSTPLIHPVDYELCTCSKAGHAFKISDTTNSFVFNSTDYEDSLHAGTSPVIGHYIVYLDQFIPYHPDNRIMGEKGINANLYYQQMNRLFEIIENNYGCKVVIAAHPAANDYINKNPFNGRQILTGVTKELVKQSIGVLAHFSTAIYFAVIYKKPLLITSSRDIEVNLKRVHTFSEAFAKELNCDYLMLDDISLDTKFSDINQVAYDRFKYNYITNPTSENISNVEVLSSILVGEL